MLSEIKLKMKKIANNNFGILVFIVGFLIILYFYNQKSLKIEEIRKNGIETIAEFNYIKKFPKREDYFFDYFLNDKKITVVVENIPEGFSSNLGKFYRIKYMEKYPNLIVVKFNQEVSDTTEIINAGFPISINNK